MIIATIQEKSLKNDEKFVDFVFRRVKWIFAHAFTFISHDFYFVKYEQVL